MRLPYITLRDPNLPHQVVLTANMRAGSGVIEVSCNCRLIHTIGGPRYKPIGVTAGLEDTRMLYNDPANHWIPFNREDRARW